MADALKVKVEAEFDRLLQRIVILMQRVSKNHMKIKILNDKQARIEQQQSQMLKRLEQLTKVLNSDNTIASYIAYKKEGIKSRSNKTRPQTE